MDAWTQPRRCVVCGAGFTLEDHGNDDARYAARHLNDGTLDPAVLPPVISKCPGCLSGRTPAQGQPTAASREAPSVSSAQEQQALAAAMAIAQELEQGSNEQLYYYVKRIGLFTGVLALGGLVLVFGYDQMSGENFSPFLWALGLLLLAGAGFGASIWAFTQSGSDGP